MQLTTTQMLSHLHRHMLTHQARLLPDKYPTARSVLPRQPHLYELRTGTANPELGMHIW